MTRATSHVPINLNFLSQLGFQFQIKRAPSVNFFIQSVTLPGMTLDPVQGPNPFVNDPQPGDHLYYEELGIQFKVDESLANYLEIHNWLKALGYPDQYEQYKAIFDQPKWTGDGIKSDLSLLITNSLKNLQFEVIFRDAFPISLSNLQFDTTGDNVEYLEAFASFAYTSYTLQAIT